jgi:hypothetical protein
MTEKRQSKFSYFTDLVDKLPTGPSRVLVITLIVSAILIIILSVPISNIAKDAYQIQQTTLIGQAAQNTEIMLNNIAHVEEEKNEIQKLLNDANHDIEHLHIRLSESNLEIERLRLQLLILAVEYDIDLNEILVTCPDYIVTDIITDTN